MIIPMITLKKETIFTASERVETRKIKVINTHHTYTHLAMHVLFIVGVWVGGLGEGEREKKVTAARASKLASLQQLSRRTIGFALSLKAQCIRVSLNLISTPSTLSCNRGGGKEKFSETIYK